jgi:hypothetical protein
MTTRLDCTLESENCHVEEFFSPAISFIFCRCGGTYRGGTKADNADTMTMAASSQSFRWT